MGSYGIGISRLMGLLAEHFADDKGLVWPSAVAPYDVYLCRLGDEADVKKAADDTYKQLESDGISVLYDDRGDRPGEQFADADLLGLPWRAVVSSNSLKAGGAELKKRGSEEVKIVPTKSIKETLGKPT